MNDPSLLSDAESRAVTAENPTGEKGRGDISTVAYWYQSEPFTDFPPLPSRDALEIV